MSDTQATPAQREYITRLLVKGQFIKGPMANHEQTAPHWGYLFSKADCAIPKGHWPTVAEWMDTLTIGQASKAIDELLIMTS